MAFSRTKNVNAAHHTIFTLQSAQRFSSGRPHYNISHGADDVRVDVLGTGRRAECDGNRNRLRVGCTPVLQNVNDFVFTVFFFLFCSIPHCITTTNRRGFYTVVITRRCSGATCARLSRIRDTGELSQ